MRARRDRTFVLMYHSVALSPRDPFWIRVQPDHFAEHLLELSRLAHVVPLASVQDREPGLRIAITFDDGYLDNFEIALPLLEQFGFPATVFVAANLLTSRAYLWWDRLEHVLLGADPAHTSIEVDFGQGPVRLALDDTDARERSLKIAQAEVRTGSPAEINEIIDRIVEYIGEPASEFAPARLLDTEQLRSLAASPMIEIGGHTRSHPMLAHLDEAAQREEILGGKRDLEAVVGAPITSFAYPFGSKESFDRRTSLLVHESGFERACTTTHSAVRRRTASYRIPRVAVRDWTGAEFRRRLERSFRPAGG